MTHSRDCIAIDSSGQTPPKPFISVPAQKGNGKVNADVERGE